VSSSILDRFRDGVGRLEFPVPLVGGEKRFRRVAARERLRAETALKVAGNAAQDETSKQAGLEILADRGDQVDGVEEIFCLHEGANIQLPPKTLRDRVVSTTCGVN
jgi:hypothetical protein